MQPAKPRVRFAPSPTGYLHVGGARTALFNWLFARRSGGTFILRIEDTDIERNRPELVDGILESLRWLGLDWDEGPIHQSQRLELYRAAAEELLAGGAAYLCYCPPDRYAGGDAAPVDEPEEAESGSVEAKQAPKQRCGCRALDAAGRKEAGERAAAQGYAPAVRFRVPEGGATEFNDAVFGRREVKNEEIEDFVILRSPRGASGAAGALPTYQLGAVVDDIDMRVTHVIRGADHLSNTPKQVLIYRALGAAPPIFAHVPLILGPDRTRLSKRHGATSVGSYQQEGFLAEAFRNFLALLGWSPGDDTQWLRTEELIRRFSLEGVSRTNAVFDRAKLEWFNMEYLQKLSVEALLPHVEGELRRARLWREEWGSTKRDWLVRTVDLIRPRTRLLPDFSTWARAFFTDDFSYDPQAAAKFWKDPQLPALLERLAVSLAGLGEWNHDACDKALRDVAAAAGVKAGLLINATRVAVVGQAVAPPLFDTMVAIRQAPVVDRIRRAIPAVKAMVPQGAAG
jgi:glutamyl-tRNA synthetase